MKYYVVAIGRKPGIYLTWEECKQQVHRVSGSKFKSFISVEEAEVYYAKYNNGNLPKNKDYKDPQVLESKERDAKYKHIVNCVICGRPFKQPLGKNGTRRNVSVCMSCKKMQHKTNSTIKEQSAGKIKRLSQNQLLYVRKKYQCEDVFSYILDNPLAVQDAKANSRGMQVSKELCESRKRGHDISSKDRCPLYINKLLGESKELIKITGDKRNPLIKFRCKRCDNDFAVHYKTLVKHTGHDCTALISSGESIVKDYLDKNKIKYLTQRETLKCVNPDTGYIMPYDFEIPSLKIIIEVQGEQHRTFIELFHIDLEGFKYQLQKDAYKKKYAEDHGYEVIEIWYSDFENGKYKVILDKALGNKEKH